MGSVETQPLPDGGARAGFTDVCATYSPVIPGESNPLLKSPDDQRRNLAALQQETASARLELQRLREEHDSLVERTGDTSRHPAGSAPTPTSEVPLMARALAGLFFAGGTLVLLCVVLAYTGSTNAVGSSIIVVNAYIVAAGLFLGASRVPRWSLPLALGWGTTLITGVAYFSGQTPQPADLVLPLDLPLLVLLLHPPPGGCPDRLRRRPIRRAARRPATRRGAAWWAVGMGTLLVTATLIWTMRDRAEAPDRDALRRRAHRSADQAAQPPRLP